MRRQNSMNFTITIHGEDTELTPAVQALVSALAQGNSAVKVDKPVTKSRVKPASEATVKDVTVETPAEDAEEEEAETEEVEGAIPTDVELRAKAAGIKAADRPKIKALLTEFGVTNLTAVPDGLRFEFMKRLDAI
jgi:hypothetical protein